MTSTFQNNEILIASIRVGENKSFEYLYKNYFKMVSTLILNNQGNEDDVKEIFQETLIVIFRKVRDDKDFELKVKFGTFIYAIARNLWRSKLKSRLSHPEIFIEDSSALEVGIEDIDVKSQEIHYEQKHLAVKETLAAMKQECKDIIEAAFFRKLPATEIAKLLGYTEEFVRVKKFRCMKELRNKVLELPLFKFDRS